MLSAKGSAYSMLRQIQWCYSGIPCAHERHQHKWCIHGHQSSQYEENTENPVYLQMWKNNIKYGKCNSSMWVHRYHMYQFRWEFLLSDISALCSFPAFSVFSAFSNFFYIFSAILYGFLHFWVSQTIEQAVYIAMIQTWTTTMKFMQEILTWWFWPSLNLLQNNECH